MRTYAADVLADAEQRIQEFVHSYDALARRNAQETIAEGEALLAIAQTLPEGLPFLPDLYLTLGIFYARAAHYEQGANYLYHSIHLLKAAEKNGFLPLAWNYLGLLYSQIGDLEAALSALLKGVQIATEEGQVIRRASCLNDLAYLYIELGHPARALQHLEECLLLIEPLSDPHAHFLLPAVWDSLSLCYIALDNFPHAEWYAQKAFSYARRDNNPWGIANVWQTLGQIAFRQTVYGKAIAAYHEAQALSHAHGYGYLEAQAFLYLGRAYAADGQIEDAFSHLRDGLTIAEQIGAKPLLHRIHEAFALLAEGQGQYERAYHHYKQFHRLRDEHYGERLEQRTKILTLMHELDTAHNATLDAHRENEALQREIAERTRLQASLERLATIDDLTQLFNRRHFFALVDHYLQDATVPCVGLLVLDVDHFKGINDWFGHEAGDVILQEVAHRLIIAATPSLPIGRYGGEEFILFLPDTDPIHAEIFAANLLETLCTEPFLVNGEAVQVTASIGVVTLSLPIERTLLFRYADKALYQAKANGRNQVIVYLPDER